MTTFTGLPSCCLATCCAGERRGVGGRLRPGIFAIVISGWPGGSRLAEAAGQAGRKEARLFLFICPDKALQRNNMTIKEGTVKRPLVGIIMGSRSDLPTMAEAAAVLRRLRVPYEMRVVSAHRTPDLMYEYARTAQKRGLEVIIAGAGGAAHLPGMTAALTRLPVIGVPVESRALKGLDSLLSIAQMPAGVPVAAVAIGTAGARNAGVLAARILALSRPEIARRLELFAEKLAESALKNGVVKA